MPEVPGGAGTILGVVGALGTALVTYLGTRYTSRSTAQPQLDNIVNARIERIFVQHATDLKDRDAEIAYLRDRMADMEQKYVFCEQRTHQLQLEVQRLKGQVERLQRPWDGQADRRRDD